MIEKEPISMSDEERDQQKGVSVPITFHIPEGLQSHYVHNILVQPGNVK